MRRFRSGFYFASHPPISTHCATYSISSRFHAQRLCTSAHRSSHRRGCGPLTDLVVKCEGKCFKYPELRELARPAIFHASLQTRMAASAACCKQLNLFLLLLARGRVFLPSLTRCSAAAAAKQLMFLDNKSNTKLAGPPTPLSALRRHHTHGPVLRRERAESLRKGEPCCELFIIPLARLNFSIENISTPASPARIDVRLLSRRGKYLSKSQ